jgi:hypothetical protein
MLGSEMVSRLVPAPQQLGQPPRLPAGFSWYRRYWRHREEGDQVATPRRYSAALDPSPVLDGLLGWWRCKVEEIHVSYCMARCREKPPV